MPLKLYLDDLRMAPEGWFRVYDVRQAISLCQTHLPSEGEISHMSLDHDLGICYCRSCAFSSAEEPCLNDNGEVTCGCTCHVPEPTGMDFLRWVHENNAWPPNRPMVHSANVVGAARMEAFINDFGPYPK